MNKTIFGLIVEPEYDTIVFAVTWGRTPEGSPRLHTAILVTIV
jgi:hypothetical protein